MICWIRYKHWIFVISLVSWFDTWITDSEDFTSTSRCFLSPLEFFLWSFSLFGSYIVVSNPSFFFIVVGFLWHIWSYFLHLVFFVMIRGRKRRKTQTQESQEVEVKIDSRWWLELYSGGTKGISLWQVTKRRMDGQSKDEKMTTENQGEQMLGWVIQ